MFALFTLGKNNTFEFDDWLSIIIAFIAYIYFGVIWNRIFSSRSIWKICELNHLCQWGYVLSAFVCLLTGLCKKRFSQKCDGKVANGPRKKKLLNFVGYSDHVTLGLGFDHRLTKVMFMIMIRWRTNEMLWHLVCFTCRVFNSNCLFGISSLGIDMRSTDCSSITLMVNLLWHCWLATGRAC